jgi:hypothetical protein
VVDLTTGLLTPQARPAQLALRIRKLLANSLRLEAYGIAAADRAKSRYSWERIARETLSAYESCPQRPAAAAKTKVRTTEPNHTAAALEARPLPAEARA